jgi:hypothetical protein
MKFIGSIVLFFSVLNSLSVFGIDSDSSKVMVDHKKSININPGIVLGSENGLTGKVEFENSKWGKIFINTEFGMYVNDGGVFITDVGIGYGYPVFYSSKRALFINGQFSYTETGGFGIYKTGQSGLIELEYRKTWNKFSISISPYYKRMFLHDYYKLKDNKVFESFSGNSFGVRVGVIYSFAL